jgi:dTDP-4-dehydrorhamnose reductase
VRALVVGSAGQVGRELLRTCPASIEVIALDLPDFDICDGDGVRRTLQEVRPGVVVNAAAYTQVDKAESEPDLAFKVNAAGAGTLARATRAQGVRLVHISTDFVFDGSRAQPWKPEDPAEPLNAYGRSKLAGEIAVAAEAGDMAVTVRTAWVYSSSGGNFVKTMLRLMATRDEIGVVTDQVGSPTWARSLAEALWDFARRPEITGVHHWTDCGVASWYDFAVAIQEEALVRGLLDREIPIRPIMSAGYPTAARRPAYSVLDLRSSIAALDRRPQHWRKSLRVMLDDIART